MKVALDVRHIRDFGIGTYIRNLVHALGVVDSAGRYVLIGSREDRQDFQKLPYNFDYVEYQRTDSHLLNDVSFPAFLRGLGPDLTHIPLNRVPLFMPQPYVVTIHDMSSLLFQDLPATRQNWWRYRFGRGLQRAERVIVVSGATRKDVEDLLNVPPEKVRLVYNAPNPEFFRHRHVADARAAGPEAVALERRRILERYQIHYPFLLYAGSIRPQKNVPRLIEAFAVAREELEKHDKYRNLRLIIIGDEISEHPEVRRTVIQSRVETVVRFLGFVPFDTLRVFYEAATAFVFPSLYEGFGLPPLEAMASGTPVITSSSSSLPEVVGDAAMLVNPENVFDIARGIKEVLLDDQLRQHLADAGKTQAAKFSWERTAREVLEVYREVAKK